MDIGTRFHLLATTIFISETRAVFTPGAADSLAPKCSRDGMLDSWIAT